MPDVYQLDSTETIPSPALIFFEELIDQNIRKMIEIAGGVDRLRPHCKTHKTVAIARKLVAAGIDRHKSATIAEAEMLAEAGARDSKRAPDGAPRGGGGGKDRSCAGGATARDAPGADPLMIGG